MFYPGWEYSCRPITAAAVVAVIALTFIQICLKLWTHCAFIVETLFIVTETAYGRPTQSNLSFSRLVMRIQNMK